MKKSVRNSELSTEILCVNDNDDEIQDESDKDSDSFTTPINSRKRYRNNQNPIPKLVDNKRKHL